MPRRLLPAHRADRISSEPTFRSAAVARMANMPVATLRIWEQRYGAVRPATAPSGHRLYSAADVQRVLLLRQLTERGHAIGSIAPLDLARLREVAAVSSPTSGAAGEGSERSTAPLRVVVVGPALALRLQRESVVRRLRLPPRLVSVFESLPEAAQAVAGIRADLLLWHAPELQPAVPPELLSVQEACGASAVGVVYRFAGADATSAIAATGAVMIREPADDASFGAWLASIPARRSVRSNERSRSAGRPPSAGRALQGVAPRRFDDAALTALAGLSSSLACECPGHIAELLMQLSSFEAYSATCINRSPEDAQLHAYLHQVAGASRAMFESALMRIADHEGLPLP